MPVERISVTTTVSSSASSTAVVDLPADIPTNSRVVIALALNTSGTITTPANWSNFQNTVDGQCRLGLYYNYNHTPTAGGTVSFTLGAVTDWCAIAIVLTGAWFHGFATFGNVSDIVSSTVSTEVSNDTSTATATALPLKRPGLGKAQRLAFAAVRHATTGFASITASTGTMSKTTEVVSSGTTPVTLALGEDSVEPPAGTWTVTATSNASSAERVVMTAAIRPDLPPVHYVSSSAGSSSAGTSGIFTISGSDSTRNQFAIMHFACSSATATFTIPAPWVQVHSTTTGSLHVETYISSMPKGIDATVDWTLSESADWACSIQQFQSAMISDDPAAVFTDWVVDTDTANDTAMTTTSLTAPMDGCQPYCFVAARGVSQGPLSGFSNTWPGNALDVSTAALNSSGSPRLYIAQRPTRAQALAGDSGTYTATWPVSTTEKLAFTALVRPPNLDSWDDAKVVVTQPSIMRSSRW